MIGGRMHSLWSGLCTRGLVLVLVLGVLAMPVPFRVVARVFVDRWDTSESSEACECDPNETLARQALSVKPETASHPKQSERGAPDDEPCSPSGCGRCALPCYGGAALASAPSAKSVDFPARTFVPPVTSSIPSSAESAGIFHPPRV